MRIASHLIGLDGFGESFGLNRQQTFVQRFEHPVHPVHDPAFVAQQDRIRQVGLLDQPRVFRNPPAGRDVVLDAESIRLVDLADVGERHGPHRQSLGQTDQPVHVPGEQAARRRAEVVLAA